MIATANNDWSTIAPTVLALLLVALISWLAAQTWTKRRERTNEESATLKTVAQLVSALGGTPATNLTPKQDGLIETVRVLGETVTALKHSVDTLNERVDNGRVDVAAAIAQSATTLEIVKSIQAEVEGRKPAIDGINEFLKMRPELVQEYENRMSAIDERIAALESK